MDSIELGEKYRDSITGFEGTATGLTVYLYGCRRVMLEGGKDGEPKTEWFDEQRLVRVTTDQPVESAATTGGPGRVAPSRDPRR
jgi:hypothetical protein